MKAIRAMEPAWIRVGEGKFSLTKYTDSNKHDHPCYSLTKTECLYIATKFNDEARAAIILRWEQLEKKNMMSVPKSFSQALMLAARQQEKIEEQQKQITVQNDEIKQLNVKVSSMEQKVSYVDNILKCTSTVKTKTIAQDYGMTAPAFNKKLNEFGVQYKQGEQWYLYAKYVGEGYVKDVPFDYVDNYGKTWTKCNMQWTQKGRLFLYEFLKKNGILPMIEQ